MKYRLFLALAFIAPAIFFGLIISRIMELDKSLILINGTMKTFKSLKEVARSSRNTFTLEEYSNVFKRSYKGLTRIIIKDRTEDLIDRKPLWELYKYDPEHMLKPKKERQVDFYANVVPTSGNSNEPITYFDLRFKKENRSQLLHYIDLFGYISKVKNGIYYLFLSLLTTILFLGLSIPVYHRSKPFAIYAIAILIIHILLISF